MLHNLADFVNDSVAVLTASAHLGRLGFKIASKGNANNQREDLTLARLISLFISNQQG
jgi:hypothetical protein